MDIRINQAVTRPPDPGAVRLTNPREPRAEQRARSGVGPMSEDPGGPGFNREPREVLRLGFGDGTVSVPGMAQRTVRRGMQNAERLVPTVEELREQVRVRSAEARERVAQQSQRNDRPVPVPQTVDYLGMEARAAAEARDFINTLDRTARRAQARLENREAPEAPKRVDIRIGDEQFRFRRPVNRSQFDALA